MKNKVIFSIVAIVILAASLPVSAQESVSLKYRGVQGRWFNAVVVDDIHRDLLELDVRREEQAHLEVQLDLRIKRIDELMLAIKSTSDALDVCKEAVATGEHAVEDAAIQAAEMEQHAIDTEEKYKKWYRHPVTWFGVGVVLTVVAGTIISSVTK